MKKYQIESAAGVVLGIYEGESESDAIAAMYRDAGYPDGLTPERDGDTDVTADVTAHEVVFSAGEALRYWQGDDSRRDGHTDEHRAEAVALILAGGPWDEEILGPRPSFAPMIWESITSEA
jgi:hypothetical protein